ncbi:hypothetical protein [Acrocarpospora catenulata]|uniref:hypothetical protein n=1 Tax=Acrocarpospora catenulata TaxID=2836182 RepID=UPI001BD99071|nr:hypothetical protein [Acrocarpospora catenulata]
MPLFDVKPLESASNPSYDIMLVAIAPSANIPHTVVDPTAKGVLRWPVRVGSAKDWLTEPQIAAAYRRPRTGRAAAARRQRLLTRLK